MLVRDTSEIRRELAGLVEHARGYVRAARSNNTRKAYQSDWRDFSAWCLHHQLESLPAQPGTVALYLTAQSLSKKTATLTRRLSAISQHHKLAGHASPAEAMEVRVVMAGIRRKKGVASKSKKPMLGASVAEAVALLPSTRLGIRDRALLLLGFSGAFRRSELVALRWDQITVTPDGLRVLIEKSKSDQEGQGRAVGIPHGSREESCPVKAIEAWQKASGQTAGPVFRLIGRSGKISDEQLSDKAVARLVKKAATALGLDPRDFSGHSLRSGLATSAAIGGASERSIMAQTGHASVQMVRRYIREGDLFRDNAANKSGL